MQKKKSQGTFATSTPATQTPNQSSPSSSSQDEAPNDDTISWEMQSLESRTREQHEETGAKKLMTDEEVDTFLRKSLNQIWNGFEERNITEEDANDDNNDNIDAATIWAKQQKQSCTK